MLLKCHSIVSCCTWDNVHALDARLFVCMRVCIWAYFDGVAVRPFFSRYALDFGILLPVYQLNGFAYFLLSSFETVCVCMCVFETFGGGDGSGDGVRFSITKHVQMILIKKPTSMQQQRKRDKEKAGPNERGTCQPGNSETTTLRKEWIKHTTKTY